MKRSPLQCRTSIIQSSALVQASSSLSMVCTRNVSTGLISSRIPFSPSFHASFLEQTHKKTMKYKYDCMNSRHKVRGLSVPLSEENTKMYAPAGCTSSQAVQVMDTTIVYNWCSKSSRSSQPCTYSDCGREWVKVEEWQNFVKSRHALESRCEFC